jgi:hypothetical protein
MSIRFTPDDLESITVRELTEVETQVHFTTFMDTIKDLMVSYEDNIKGHLDRFISAQTPEPNTSHPNILYILDLTVYRKTANWMIDVPFSYSLHSRTGMYNIRTPKNTEFLLKPIVQCVYMAGIRFITIAFTPSISVSLSAV